MSLGAALRLPLPSSRCHRALGYRKQKLTSRCAEVQHNRSMLHRWPHAANGKLPARIVSRNRRPSLRRSIGRFRSWNGRGGRLRFRRSAALQHQANPAEFWIRVPATRQEPRRIRPCSIEQAIRGRRATCPRRPERTLFRNRQWEGSRSSLRLPGTHARLLLRLPLPCPWEFCPQRTSESARWESADFGGRDHREKASRGPKLLFPHRPSSSECGGMKRR